MNKVSSVIAMAFLSFAIGNGQTASWTMDKSHSQVTFTVGHLVISEVTGFFKDFDVKMVSDKDDLTDAQIETTIKTSSIDTGNERRDNHIRGDDFLNSEKFPEMKFKSTMIEKSGEDTYKITGDLTIRDVTKSVVLDTKHKGIINDTRGVRSVFKATTMVNRFDFGVKWDRLMEGGGLVAGKDVEVRLSLELTKPKQ